MFLWQKYKYRKVFLKSDEDFMFFKTAYLDIKPKIVAFDTETTGLHIIKDKPFLVGIGFDKILYVYEPTVWRNNFIYELLLQHKPDYFLAHNAKFDYHMMRNAGSPIPEGINVADTYALARITDYVDSLGSLGLEALGSEHVDEDAKFAGKVIKEHLNLINKERYKIVKQYIKDNVKGITYSSLQELRKHRVQFVPTKWDEHLDEIEKIAPYATYEDSYKEKPELMINYLADDVLLVLEVFKALIPILDKVDKGRKTWHRENKLVRVVGDFESNGLRVDVGYILTQRDIVYDYIEKTYKELWELAGKEFSVGQHAVIKQLFREKYAIGMLKTDEDALEEIQKYYEEEPRQVATLILELRTLSKWLSTYIEGMLNRVVDGKVYTDINNSGASTGRVSSDMQQQPKKALYGRDGTELFHPRKPFIAEEGYTNFYIDFSNMELRVQAYYTLLTSEGDTAMCRAFMPFKCTNAVTGELFDPIKHLHEWDSGEWFDENGDPWEAVDLHTATTVKAFPDIALDDPDFHEIYRALGKRANFLKNYGGGKKALIKKLKIDSDTADALNNGYYSAFPKVLDYQQWVDNQVKTYGVIKNLYGRAYYFQDTSFAYKGYNYLIQGSCADYVKAKEIEIADFLKDYESKMLLPIHDEIVFSIKKGEEHLIKKIKEIMDNAYEMMPLVPMVAEVSVTKTNWAEKEVYNG